MTPVRLYGSLVLGLLALCGPDCPTAAGFDGIPLSAPTTGQPPGGQSVLKDEPNEFWAAFRDSITVKTSTQLPPPKLLNLRDLRPDSEQPKIRSFLGSGALLPGKMQAEIETAHTAREEEGQGARSSSAGRMARLGVTGHFGAITYGLSYRNAGKEFLVAPDQGKREVWGEWQAKMIRVRNTLTEVWTNVDRDPSRPQVRHMQERLSVFLAPPTWGEASLSYGRGLLASNMLAQGVTLMRNQSHLLEGAYTFSDSKWSGRLSSTYTTTSDQLNSGQETKGFIHALTGTLRPVEGMTLVPIISLREDRQGWSGTKTETTSASMTVTYTQGAQVNVLAQGTYSGMKSSDGLLDRTTVQARGVASWSPPSDSETKTTISLESLYQSAVDATNQTPSMQNLTVLARLSVSGF